MTPSSSGRASVARSRPTAWPRPPGRPSSLERGQAYPPGSFARNPYGCRAPSGSPRTSSSDFFDVRSFRKLEAVVSSGLGGGSLIYANVLLRKDERWFVHDSPIPGGGYEHWPVSRADLDPHYDAVASMLNPTPSPYPRPAQGQGAARGGRAQASRPSPRPSPSRSLPPGESRPRSRSSPKASYGNIHGLTRLTCRLCGECDIGCNEGSKNTLDHTYLSAAKHHGADIRTLAEVTGIVPLDGGGFEVTYTQYGHDPDDSGDRSRTPVRIRCDSLFLAAGTFGTATLLLRNRVSLPALGRALGTRFSGNGDLLTFCMNAQAEGPTGRMRLIDGSLGPVIDDHPRPGRSRRPGQQAGLLRPRQASPSSPTGSSRPRRWPSR